MAELGEESRFDNKGPVSKVIVKWSLFNLQNGEFAWAIHNYVSFI